MRKLLPLLFLSAGAWAQDRETLTVGTATAGRGATARGASKSLPEAIPLSAFPSRWCMARSPGRCSLWSLALTERSTRP